MYTMTNVENLNRLVRRGLPITVAMDVDAGRLNEEFQVALWTTRREAERWAKYPANRSVKFTPVWDLAPSRFYMALDGERQDSIDAAALTVIEVAMDELLATLQHGSGRDDDPWLEQFCSKTAGIAYCWAKGLAVTPPLIRPCSDEIVIVGGMHRLHLARHYDARSIPVLLWKEDLDKLLWVKPSAR